MMFTKFFTVPALLLASLAAAGTIKPADDCPTAYKAVAVIAGPNNVTGTVIFTQSADSREVSVTGQIHNLSPNAEHGFHIHTFGDLSGGCASAGGHFNPYNKPHGAPDAKKRHVGDLGNIKTDSQGIATIDIKDSIISLRNNKRGIIGRGVVVHAGADDMGLGGQPDSLTTGHAGDRAGCGVIGIANATAAAV